MNLETNGVFPNFMCALNQNHRILWLESEQLFSCTKEKQESSKVIHSIAWKRCKNIIFFFFPCNNTAKKNGRKAYAQK